MGIKSRFLVLPIALVLCLSLWSALYGQFVETQFDTWRKLVTPYDFEPLISVRTNASQTSAPSGQKPLFVLHVGPSKTGTTTVQWFAANYKDLLEKDNIYFLGHFKNATSPPECNLHVLSDLCYSCKGQEKCTGCDAKWKQLEQVVDRHYEKNHSVFVSNEMFSGFRPEKFEKEPLWQHLVPMIEHRWEVRVIFTYRRYYEWMPSKYFQLYNPNTSKMKGRTWPDKGGRKTPTFPDYWDSHLKDTFKHPVLLKRKWESYFPNVWVFNMHGDGDYLADFFCKMIPESKHACDYLSSRNVISSSTINPSTNKLLHFDMLAVEAYSKGWVNGTAHSRNEVREAVRDYAGELGMLNLTDFRLKCLSRTQSDRFLNMSLSMEQELVPEFYSSPQGKGELELGFAKATQQGKFCSLHVEKVLKEERWRKFFRKRFLGSGNFSPNKLPPEQKTAERS